VIEQVLSPREVGYLAINEVGVLATPDLGNEKAKLSFYYEELDIILSDHGEHSSVEEVLFHKHILNLVEGHSLDDSASKPENFLHHTDTLHIEDVEI
jgi:hypothetical protein